MRKKKKILVLGIILMVCMAVTADAADKRWYGYYGPEWDNLYYGGYYNWSPSGLPDSDDFVKIPPDMKYDPVIDNFAAVAMTVIDESTTSSGTLSFTIQNGGSLTCQNLYLGEATDLVTTLDIQSESNTATVTCGEVRLGHNGGTGIVNIGSAGTLLAVTLTIEGSLSSVDISGDGQLQLWGNQLSELESGGTLYDYIIDGQLTSYGDNPGGDPENIPDLFTFNYDDGNDVTVIEALECTSFYELTIAVSPNDINTIDPAAGTYEYCPGRAISLVAGTYQDCPAVYQFDHWIGDVNDVNSASTFIVIDANETVTAYYADQRACGDACHPIQQGDLNEDCYINLEDFAIYADNWLSCTHPDCD